MKDIHEILDFEELERNICEINKKEIEILQYLGQIETYECLTEIKKLQEELDKIISKINFFCIENNVDKQQEIDKLAKLNELLYLVKESRNIISKIFEISEKIIGILQTLKQSETYYLLNNKMNVEELKSIFKRFSNKLYEKEIDLLYLINKIEFICEINLNFEKPDYLISRSLLVPIFGNKDKKNKISWNFETNNDDDINSYYEKEEYSKKPQLKKVEFSAVLPELFYKDEYTIIDIVMYEKAYRKIVDELVKGVDIRKKEIRAGMFKVSENAKIKIILHSPDIDIEEKEIIQEWQGDYLNFSFVVKLPKEYQKTQILFNATVYIDNIVATKLNFTVNSASHNQQKLNVIRKDITSAFVSYASQDRKKVASIVFGMKKIRPDLDIFFDVESLRSGDDWEEEIKNEVKNRDLLFLCWSHFAKKSEWVEKEWRFVLENKGLEGIEPIPLELPHLCPPPKELSGKHFNDVMLYVINSN